MRWDTVWAIVAGVALAMLILGMSHAGWRFLLGG